MSNNLKQRLLTGLPLLALVIAAIFFLPHFEFILLSGALILIAGWEWCNLTGWKTLLEKFMFSVVLVGSFFLCHYFYKNLAFLIAAIWWLGVLFLLYQYSQKSNQLMQNKYSAIFIGLILLLPCWLGLNTIREFGSGYLLFALLLVWSMDTGAYLAGRKFGKRKLMPAISPGKTIEGLWGGFILMFIITIIGLLILKIPFLQWPVWLLLSFITAMASVIGDLFESMVKRQANVKDSGNILPGHGGMLDRIDSLTAAMPIFALGILIINRFYHA